ncbi:hypothetical protein P154DRAFT_204456 [Amniculicola lignicola CBS 123094]|uniref:Uncharacterized protein n=1 Tax=Amniculicola lignicola CBS 123094 TaxID=1392246 RepID=A0A6A5WJ88_9PLEO|nr:hypothetical protein P154DRAFT_204456 [Amniculicola lignicola CBS 123094]
MYHGMGWDGMGSVSTVLDPGLFFVFFSFLFFHFLYFSFSCKLWVIVWCFARTEGRKRPPGCFLFPQILLFPCLQYKQMKSASDTNAQLIQKTCVPGAYIKISRLYSTADQRVGE